MVVGLRVVLVIVGDYFQVDVPSKFQPLTLSLKFMDRLREMRWFAAGVLPTLS